MQLSTMTFGLRHLCFVAQTVTVRPGAGVPINHADHIAKQES